MSDKALSKTVAIIAAIVIVIGAAGALRSLFLNMTEYTLGFPQQMPSQQKYAFLE